MTTDTRIPPPTTERWSSNTHEIYLELTDNWQTLRQLQIVTGFSQATLTNHLRKLVRRGYAERCTLKFGSAKPFAWRRKG